MIRRLPKTGLTSDNGFRFDGLPGWIVIPTFWACHNHNPPFYCALEYRLLTSVVHAGLAKIVRWLSFRKFRFEGEHDHFLGKFVKFVSVSVERFFLKLQDFLFKLTLAVFARAFRINARLCFLGDIACGRCDLKHFPAKDLLEFGDLVLIPCSDGGFNEVDGRINAGDSCRNTHGRSFLDKEVV